MREYTAHVIEETIEDVTMNASGDNELVNQGGGGDSLMHGGNVEFSDIEEPLVIEPVRTRSQSRAKEPSQPPSDIEKKKKGRPKKSATQVKQHRRIIVETDDEIEED